jgi:hypothetical protein
VDFQRAITGRRYKLIYNAQPNQPYSPVDQGGRFLDPAQDTSEIGKHEILPAIARADAERALGAWKDIVEAHQAGKLAPLHESSISSVQGRFSNSMICRTIPMS